MKKTGYDIGVVVGMLMFVRGVWMWSHPLAFVLGGAVVAVTSFLSGYAAEKLGRRV